MRAFSPILPHHLLYKFFLLLLLLLLTGPCATTVAREPSNFAQNILPPIAGVPCPYQTLLAATTVLHPYSPREGIPIHK